MKSIAKYWTLLMLAVAFAACANTNANHSKKKMNLQNMTSSETKNEIEGDTSNAIDTIEMATFGAGCFWCVEAVYTSVNGVLKVQSGYSGGFVKNPSYKEVCSGNTGHAEVCQITFDPRIITYLQLLEVFFEVHDPTTLNRQGGDVGTQYRSAIYYHNNAQMSAAQLAISAATESENWSDQIVTEVTEFDTFFPAEDYHNDYFALHGEQPYCQMVVKPKVDKFKKHFGELLKK